MKHRIRLIVIGLLVGTCLGQSENIFERLDEMDSGALLVTLETTP